MANDGNNLFRKESIENMTSPEQLHDYIRVPSPPLWLTLIAVFTIIVCFLIWSIWGNMTVMDTYGNIYVNSIQEIV